MDPKLLNRMDFIPGGALQFATGGGDMSHRIKHLLRGCYG